MCEPAVRYTRQWPLATGKIGLRSATGILQYIALFRRWVQQCTCASGHASFQGRCWCVLLKLSTLEADVRC